MTKEEAEKLGINANIHEETETPNLLQELLIKKFSRPDTKGKFNQVDFLDWFEDYMKFYPCGTDIKISPLVWEAMEHYKAVRLTNEIKKHNKEVKEGDWEEENAFHLKPIFSRQDIQGCIERAEWQNVNSPFDYLRQCLNELMKGK